MLHYNCCKTMQMADCSQTVTNETLINYIKPKIIKRKPVSERPEAGENNTHCCHG